MVDHNAQMVASHIRDFEELKKVAENFKVWKAEIMVEHLMLKEGVANFKVFKERGTKFFDRAETLWADQERRRKRTQFILSIAALFLVPLSVWGCAELVRAGITMYQIEIQWQQAHPSEFKQQKSVYDSPDGVYAVDRAPQDAHVPPMRR